MRFHVIVPTTGRADVARQTVDRLWTQSRPPDGVTVVAVTPTDVQGIGGPTRIAFASRGLCAQRNHGLELLHEQADLIVFFDDDFVPANDFLKYAERLFEQNEHIVGACGRPIADGVRGDGITFEQAVRLVEQDPGQADRDTSFKPQVALYGCNMVFRAAALGGLTFDENLPLYGWQEDIDFTYRLGRRGVLAESRALAGVHMGVKAGRSPGRRLGYSQIANPIYLLRKGGMPRDMAIRLMLRNAMANLTKSLQPEPLVDRRGRLVGNLLAIRDLILGRLDPRRILELQ